MPTPIAREELASLAARATPAAHAALLGTLEALAAAALRPELAASESSRGLALGLVRELAGADNAINQGDRGTCAVTALSHDLATRQPAEYARLVAGLATRGEVTLASGDRLQVPADAWASDGSERSTSERLLQAALMQYAHPDATYHSAWGRPGDGARDGFDDRPDGGLTPEELVRVLDGVYARPHAVDRGGSSWWRDGDAMLAHARQHLARGQGPVLAFLDWPPGQHVVELLRVQGDRVVFRNPIGGPEPYRGGGESTLRVGHTGATYAAPSRRVESGMDAEESMRAEDLADVLREVVAPSTPAP